MTTAPVRKVVTLTVEEVAPVAGNRGPQFKLTWKGPNEHPHSFGQFPFDAWIDDEGQGMPALGKYVCLIERRPDVRRDRNGKPHDGSMDRHWNWRILDFDVHGEPDGAQPEEPIIQEFRDALVQVSRDPTRDSIERQVLTKEARIATEWLLEHRAGDMNAAGDLFEYYFKTFDRALSRLVAIFYAAEGLQEAVRAPQRAVEVDAHPTVTGTAPGPHGSTIPSGHDEGQEQAFERLGAGKPQ